ncbi:MAG: hypothetical protein HS103_06105 [Anaerolineales bacterium]|nr:hypothetical protein [Anaerolineales bacterium]
MNLIKLIRIARREYLTNFRRRSFLFTMFGLPIFLVAIFLIIGVVTTSAIDSIDGFKRIGVVDQAGVFPGREIPAPLRSTNPFRQPTPPKKAGKQTPIT